MSEVKSRSEKPVIIAVEDSQDGQRLDNFLISRLKGVPKSHVYRITRRGEVRVNGGRARPSRKLQTGDQVRIPPLRLASPGEPVRLPDLEARLAAAVLYEAGDLLVLDKPAGIAVHGGSGVRAGVIELLRAQRGPGGFLELVHRLDRDTSGCLMLASKASRLRDLQQLLREHLIDKRYLLLVRGIWPSGRRRVEAPLARSKPAGGEHLTAIDDRGKMAVTEFELIRHLPGASLVGAKLLTGKTHQIRVHAAAAGHPLAGDEKYGDAEFNRLMRRDHGLHRLFLHAASLRIPGSPDIEVQAPLPLELQRVLDSISVRRSAEPSRVTRAGTE